jgi:gamma-glutamyltranspeptidase / glutathione hydrolase
VLQVIINVIDFHMNVQDAVDFPRIHHQWKPDRLDFETVVSPDTVSVLKHMGYSIEEAHPKILARVEAILISDGWLQGANDSRSSDRLGGDGKAAGY